jgi:hypothetical protein
MADQFDSRYATDFPDQILYPEYAIGQKLITREEYDQLETIYVTQAQAAFGLILPSVLLLIAIWFTGVLALATSTVVVVGVLLFVAALVGMDRLHKFNSELQLLIVSRWDAMQEAKKAAAAAAAAKKATDQANAQLLKALKEDIDELKIVTKNLADKTGGHPEPPPEDTSGSQGPP